MTIDTTTTTAPAYDAMAPLALDPGQPQRWADLPEPMTFDDAYERVRAEQFNDGPHSDVDTPDLATWVAGRDAAGYMALAPVPLPGRAQRAPLALTRHAFRQLCSDIGAPAAYLEKLPGKLQTAALNFGMQRARRGDNALPRTFRLSHGGRFVRAVVSDRYAPFSNVEVLDVLGDVLGRAGMLDDVRVRSVITGGTTALRLTFPGEAVEVRARKVGDIIEHGLDVRNSEVGSRSVQLDGVSFRLVCLNGMVHSVMRGRARMRHVGSASKLRDGFAEAVPVIVAGMRDELKRWSKAVDQWVENSVDELESLRGFGFTGPQVQAVEASVLRDAVGADRAALSEGDRVTVFDVANGITDAARGLDTAARLEMEAVAGTYLRRRVAL